MIHAYYRLWFMCLALFFIEGKDPVPFSFDKKPLMDIIDLLAEKKQLNIIVPQGAADLEALRKQTITYHTPKKRALPIDQAWSLLTTFLELSGFSIAPKQNNLYEIARTSAIEGGSSQRTPLALYIDTDPYSLPKDDQRIRYFAFLRSLKVPTAQEKEGHPLTKMLRQLLTKDAPILYDTKANSVLIIDKASHISSIIALLKDLDSKGLVEEVAYVPLRYIPAASVANIFDSLKKAAGEEGAPFLRTDPGSDALAHFARDTRFITDPPRNALILLGRANNVERITDFIQEAIDVPPSRGISILHHYDLQYLDAQAFAPQLQQIVSTLITTGQATQAPVRRGQEHLFKGVQVVAEPVVTSEPHFTTEEVTVAQTKGTSEKLGIEGVSTQGGNRLIIAAREDDWNLIKAFIKKLDIPQYTVILEILIVDFTYSVTKNVSGDIRSKTNMCSSTNGVEFLSSNITPVSNVLGTTPTQLAEDLLQVVGPQSVTNQLAEGSLLISFNDPQTPGIFALLQLLNQILNVKISSYPYLMVTNNKKGSVESQMLRRVQGDLVTTADGSFTIPIEDVQATLQVIATPHVLTDNRVRLDIGFTSEDFVGTTFTRRTRGLKTTATLSSGQILVLGGLLRTDNLAQNTQTPFLGAIPILGAFFRGSNDSFARSNISLFVVPTIIEPRTQAHLLTEKTHDQLCRTLSEDRPFGDPKDPIYHIFLKDEPDRVTDRFFGNTKNLPNFTKTGCTLPSSKLFTALPIISPRPYNHGALKDLLAQQTEPFSGIKQLKR